jgi:hypothetical protein
LKVYHCGFAFASEPERDILHSLSREFIMDSSREIISSFRVPVLKVEKTTA